MKRGDTPFLTHKGDMTKNTKWPVLHATNFTRFLNSIEYG